MEVFPGSPCIILVWLGLLQDMLQHQLAGGVGCLALGLLRRGRSQVRSCEPCARSNEVLFPPQTKFRVKEDLSSGKGVLQRKCFRESLA